MHLHQIKDRRGKGAKDKKEMSNQGKQTDTKEKTNTDTQNKHRDGPTDRESSIHESPIIKSCT